MKNNTICTLVAFRTVYCGGWYFGSVVILVTLNGFQKCMLTEILQIIVLLREGLYHERERE